MAFSENSSREKKCPAVCFEMFIFVPYLFEFLLRVTLHHDFCFWNVGFALLPDLYPLRFRILHPLLFLIIKRYLFFLDFLISALLQKLIWQFKGVS